MVSYMWGKDVADALANADDDAPKLTQEWADRAVRVVPLKPTITFNPVDKPQSTD